MAKTALSSKDHSTKVWLQLAQWFLRRRFLCEFPIGSYFKLSSAVGAILIEGPNHRTHFWKRTKIVSVSVVLYPKWPPLLTIEISSNGQNCSILSQKVPKFELYKHNDELFNILLSKWFQTRRLLWEFPIGSYVKLSSAVVAILVCVLKCRTQFWKRTTQESFQQSLVEIGSVVSEAQLNLI
jgi:hypothetical protein